MRAQLVCRSSPAVRVVLGHQQHLLRNATHLRLALVQHTLLELLPLPLPTAECFWQREPMRAETQADLMRTLHRLSRAYLGACLSLPNTPSVDASRMTVMAALLCFADAVLRAHVPVSPSLFCEHYTGRAAGPATPYAVSLGSYPTESESAPIFNPSLALARPRLLSYMASRVASLENDDHLLFAFDQSMRPQPSDLRFLSQLALASGLPPQYAPHYLAGTVSAPPAARTYHCPPVMVVPLPVCAPSDVCAAL